MTPKPCNLPPVAEMTPTKLVITPKPEHLKGLKAAQIPEGDLIAEAARILRNMGGPEYDAGYSWGLAERLEGLRDDGGIRTHGCPEN